VLQPFHLRLGLQSSRFSSGFATKILCAFIICPMIAIWLTHSSFSIWSSKLYLVKSLNYGSSRYAIFFRLSSLHLRLRPKILINTLFQTA
jgi:hypothetical protein